MTSSFGCIGGQMCSTCPAPCTARLSDSLSVKSPMTTSAAPVWRSSGPTSARRTSARTAPPRFAIAATIRRPVFPEAPVTRTGFLDSMPLSSMQISQGSAKLGPVLIAGVNLGDFAKPCRGRAETGRKIAMPSDKKLDVRQLPFELFADLGLVGIIGRCQLSERLVVSRTQVRCNRKVELPQHLQLLDLPVVEQLYCVCLTAIGAARAVQSLLVQRLGIDRTVDVFQPARERRIAAELFYAGFPLQRRVLRLRITLREYRIHERLMLRKAYRISSRIDKRQR